MCSSDLATTTGGAGTSTVVPGDVGVANTMLRPSGKGQFSDKLVDVVTAGDLIEKGAAIRIVAVRGSRVEVERMK